MHYIKFRHIARGIFLSSCVVLLAFLSALTMIGFGIALLVTQRDDLIIPFGISVGVFCGIALIQFVVTAFSRCQLCQSLALKPLKCSKVPTAGTIFGSYRLKVALTTVFLGRFRCPYCGEIFYIWVKPEEAVIQSNTSTRHSRKAGSRLPTRRE